jgi:hypothetical protein
MPQVPWPSAGTPLPSGSATIFICNPASEIYSQGNRKSAPLRLRKRMKNGKAGDNSLDEKKDGVELMIALVSCDRSRRQAGKINQATNELLRP